MKSNFKQASPASKVLAHSAPSVVNTSRKEFLDDLPPKMKNTVRGVDLTLINEAIVAIMEGHASINGKAPATRAERFIVIASYFKTARTSLNMFFDGALNVKGTYSVVFKHKEIPYTIQYPESITPRMSGSRPAPYPRNGGPFVR